MHEWALAEAVISTAVKVAEREKLTKVSKIRVRIGELQQIDREIFEFALREMAGSEGGVLEGVRVEFEDERAVLKCRICGYEWTFGEAIGGLSEEESESIHFVPEIAHVYIRCPRCKSPDFEIIKGRGVSIESIEGE